MLVTELPNTAAMDMAACRDVPPTVLVVDDDPGIAEGLQRALRRKVCILSATDARKAKGIIAAEMDLSLIVLDLAMPEYDAIEFLKEVGGTPGFPPVVLISGRHRDMLDLVARFAGALGLPVIGTLEKPFVTEGLTKILLALRQREPSR